MYSCLSSKQALHCEDFQGGGVLMNLRGYAAPFGPLVIGSEDGAIVKLRFGECGDSDPCPVLDLCIRELDAYFAGKLREFTVPVNPRGTEFQKKAWDALLGVPYGETQTYRDIAEKVGNVKAVRAVGGANNRNPVAIIIPCHRIIGVGGGLTGYAGGLHAKEFLLKLERGR
jgi:methylated-DNA-[protein]-cysteine S-methyltransferase